MKSMLVPIEQIHEPLFKEKAVSVFVKREDLNHPTVSGNKFRKLKYNLAEAKRQGQKQLLTFGGAYSNPVSYTHLLTWVESIESWFNGGLMVVLRGGEKVEVSRRQAARFKEMMSL